MTQTQQHCSTPEHLLTFLRGQLSSQEESELQLHLNDCVSCRERLEDAAADANAWNEARQFFGNGGLHGLTDDSTGDHEAATQGPQRIRQVLDALGPTDDPESLGRIGGYEVTGVVGAGGMGVVLKAHDRSLDRIVAIKVMSPHLASSGSARKRFAREAKAAAAVLHPNVIAIHGVANEDANPYLVMPYVRGASLQKRIDSQGPLPLKDTLRIGAQIAAGLAAAHEQGLVHRDIKPENILLEEGVERVTITDFGLARAVDDASMTCSGVIAGTPQYMSPEQARGEPIDARSDLFSLGSVMYAMCAGRSPFRAETTYGVLHRIANDNPTPVCEVNSDVPEWLGRIIARLMAKHAEDRFESAAQVAELLEGCLAHVQQPAAVHLPESVTALVAKRTRRLPVGKFIATAAGSVALLFAGILIVLEFGKGTLTIESEVDDVPIRIMQGDEVVKSLTVSKEGATTRISAGKYIVEIGQEFDKAAIKDGGIELSRGTTAVVKVTQANANPLEDEKAKDEAAKAWLRRPVLGRTLDGKSFQLAGHNGLMHCVMTNNSEALNRLLSMDKYDLDFSPRNGQWTLLQTALQHSCLETTALLLQHGAKPTFASKGTPLPLELAQTSGRTELVLLVQEYIIALDNADPQTKEDEAKEPSQVSRLDDSAWSILQGFTGDWKLNAISFDGGKFHNVLRSKMSATIRPTFGGNNLEMFIGSRQMGPAYEIGFLDTSIAPMQITLNRYGTFQSLLSFEDEVLTLARPIRPGESRPHSLQPAKGIVIYRWTRMSEQDQDRDSFVTIPLKAEWIPEEWLKRNVGRRHLTIVADGLIKDEAKPNVVNRVQRGILHDCRLESYEKMSRAGVEYWNARLFVPRKPAYSIGALWFKDAIRTHRIGDRHTPVPSSDLTQDNPQVKLDEAMKEGHVLRLDYVNDDFENNQPVVNSQNAESTSIQENADSWETTKVSDTFSSSDAVKAAKLQGKWEVKTNTHGDGLLIANGRMRDSEEPFEKIYETIPREEFLAGPWFLDIDEDDITLRHGPSDFPLMSFEITMSGKDTFVVHNHPDYLDTGLQGRFEITESRLKLVMAEQSDKLKSLTLGRGEDRIYFECVHADPEKVSDTLSSSRTSELSEADLSTPQATLDAIDRYSIAHPMGVPVECFTEAALQELSGVMLQQLCFMSGLSQIGLQSGGIIGVKDNVPIISGTAPSFHLQVDALLKEHSLATPPEVCSKAFELLARQTLGGARKMDESLVKPDRELLRLAAGILKSPKEFLPKAGELSERFNDIPTDNDSSKREPKAQPKYMIEIDGDQATATQIVDGEKPGIPMSFKLQRINQRWLVSEAFSDEILVQMNSSMSQVLSAMSASESEVANQLDSPKSKKAPDAEGAKNATREWGDFLKLLPESGTALVMFSYEPEIKEQMLPVAKKVAEAASAQLIVLPLADWRKVVSPEATHFVLMKDRQLVGTRTGLMTEARLQDFVDKAKDWLTPQSTGIDENSLVRIDCYINPSNNNIGSQHGAAYPLTTAVVAVHEDYALLLGPDSIAEHMDKGYACVAMVRDEAGNSKQVPLDVVQIGPVKLVGQESRKPKSAASATVTLGDGTKHEIPIEVNYPKSITEPLDAYDTGSAVYLIRGAHGLSTVKLATVDDLPEVQEAVLSGGFNRDRQRHPLFNFTSPIDWQSQTVASVDSSVYGGNVNGPELIDVLCPTRPTPCGFTFNSRGQLIGKYALGHPTEDDMTHTIFQPDTTHSVLLEALMKIEDAELKSALEQTLEAKDERAVIEPAVSIRHSMEHMINPAFEALHEAIHSRPIPKIEWDTIKGKALTLSEAGNLLRHRGAKDDQRWIAESDKLRNQSRMLFEATENRDLSAAMEHVNAINESCTNCHRLFRGRSFNASSSD